MKEAIEAINNLLDLYIESKNENKMIRTELKVAGQKNSQLKDENGRLRKIIREGEKHAKN